MNNASPMTADFEKKLIGLGEHENRPVMIQVMPAFKSEMVEFFWVNLFKNGEISGLKKPIAKEFIGVAILFLADGIEFAWSSYPCDSSATNGLLNNEPVISERGDQVGYVYFIRSGPTGPIKIGWALDVEQRINTLQTGNPEKIELLGYVTGTVLDEMELHRNFDSVRLRGEWFNPAEELLSFVVRACEAERHANSN